MDRMERRADKTATSPRRQRKDARADAFSDEDGLLDNSDIDDERDFGGSNESGPPAPIFTGEAQPEAGEQAEFREQFDEDLYNDREDRPAQGNTADVAMGEHRFGSDAEAYSEYAYRRPGGHHQGDESAVGQARDPADITTDNDRS